MKQKDFVKVKGFFRVQISDEDGQIVGDSGLTQNQVTNEGIRNYLCRALGALVGSSQIGSAALGSGAAPASNATTLPNELGEAVRKAVTAATNGSSAVQFTATFASSDSFVTATRTLSNIGLFAGAGGTVFAGNTYASSTVATNQQVNATYTISFS